MKTQLTLLFALVVNQVQAWGGKGHLLISRIAYDILDETAPETLEKINNVLSILKKDDAYIVQNEGDHPMVECATFADDIKWHGGRWQSSWHFIDKPYLDQGGKISDFNFTADVHNITEAIDSIVDWFNQEEGFDKSYVYQQINEHLYQGLGVKDGLSTALRLLIHYVGDVHQPLHASSRVNKDYPKGDRGGNDFALKSHYGVKELHAVWDDVFWTYFHKQVTPFSAEDWASQGKNITMMQDRWPVNEDDAQNLNSMDWADESFDITRTFVYKDIKENTSLGDDYVKKGLDLSEQRIVLAGHRLANLLKSLNLDQFETKNMVEAETTETKGASGSE